MINDIFDTAKSRVSALNSRGGGLELESIGTSRTEFSSICRAVRKHVSRNGKSFSGAALLSMDYFDAILEDILHGNADMFPASHSIFLGHHKRIALIPLDDGTVYVEPFVEQL